MRPEEIVLNLNWHAIGIILSVLTAWSALLLGAIRFFMARELRAMDSRFQALETSRERVRRAQETNLLQHADIEKQILQLRADLPQSYVQREDWIRFSGTLEFKMDAIHRRIDELKPYLMGGDGARP